MNNPPADPLRKAARSSHTATRLTAQQVRFAASHDWFVSATAEGIIVVRDLFTFEDKAFEEAFIWGGTFAELRNWAGY